MLLRRFLFVMCSPAFGSSSSFRNDHGPGPMKFDTISPTSSSGFTTSYSGDCLNASVSSETSGRSAGPSFLGCFNASSDIRLTGSVLATRRKPVQ